MSEDQQSAPAKEQILVAEDSVPNRKILVHLLTKLGFDVISCDDGKVAWQKLEDGSEIKNLVAIISDIMMPNCDGIQLLEKVREHESYKDLPFVLATAVSEKEYIIRAKALNVNGYILKPITFDRVTKKLNELFPNKTFPKLAG